MDAVQHFSLRQIAVCQSFARLVKRELVVVLHPGDRIAAGVAPAKTPPVLGVDDERIAFVLTVQRTLEGGIIASTKTRLAEVALDKLAQVELCLEFFYIDHGVHPTFVSAFAKCQKSEVSAFVIRDCR